MNASADPPPIDPPADPPADPPPLPAAASGWRGMVARERALLLWLLIVAGAVFAFLKLASEVGEGETLAFDRAILVALRQTADLSSPVGPGWFNEAMTDITAFGSTTGLILVAGAVILYLLVARRPWTALFVLGATGGGAVMGQLLKLVYERPRPDVVPHLVAVSDASFPSGHTTDSAIVYLTLAALIARTTKRPVERTYIIGFAAFMTVIIGFSRMYLGVHWPTDVAAGWTIGVTWALFCSILYRRFQRQPRAASASLAPAPATP